MSVLSNPIIPATKNYWLIRTNRGRYYREFKSGGFIAVNWDKVSFDEIYTLSTDELALRVKKAYPRSQLPARSANQLRIFATQIKTGDVVIITGISSNEVCIGEVLSTEPYLEEIPQRMLEADPGRCPYQKRKRVHWHTTQKKWELGTKLYDLVQHAQHTITEINADEYGFEIEGLVHDFFIRGEEAQLALHVRKEGHIPFPSFFLMGGEILKIAQEFNNFSQTLKIDLEAIDIKINVNSPGKIKMAGKFASITILGMILVGLAGGGLKVSMPEYVGGGGIDISMNSIVATVSDFLDRQQIREQEQKILETYMKELRVETPEDLAKVLNAIKNDGVEEVTKVINVGDQNGSETSEKQ